MCNVRANDGMTIKDHVSVKMVLIGVSGFYKEWLDYIVSHAHEVSWHCHSLPAEWKRSGNNE
jgi:hypothetical protein